MTRSRLAIIELRVADAGTSVFPSGFIIGVVALVLIRTTSVFARLSTAGDRYLQ